MKPCANPASALPPLKARTLHHDDTLYFRAPGCAQCVDHDRCGGLNTAQDLLDCSIHCCGQPDRCQWVCRRNPQFRRQIQEIGGLSLANVTLVKKPTAPELPNYIPQLYHRSLRQERLTAPAVAIKLAQLFDKRTGAPLIPTRAELNRRFMIDDSASVVVTGVDIDPVIERWWRIGQSARQRLIDHLVSMQVALATGPNYTLSLNWPRIGDLAAMKRILLCYAELMNGGLPTALHVNGRTPRDFERWAEVLRRLDGISHIAYEFTTGAAHGARREQHIAWLQELAAHVDRPLHLIAFGDCRVVVPLKTAFAQVTWIDTTSFMKTINRRRAMRAGNGRLVWSPAPTATGEPLHHLLAHNIEESRAHFAMRTAA